MSGGRSWTGPPTARPGYAEFANTLDGIHRSAPTPRQLRARGEFGGGGTGRTLSEGPRQPVDGEDAAAAAVAAAAAAGAAADITNRMKTPSGDGGEAQPEVTNAAAAASVWTRPLDGHHTGAIRSQLERCGYPWPLQDNEMLRRLINRLAGGTQGHYTKIVNAIGTPTLDALKKVMRAERDTHGRPVWERTKRERDSQSERAVAKRARCKRDSVSEQVIAEDLSAATLSRAHATGLIEAGGLSGAMMVLQVWNCLGGWSWKDKDLRLAFCQTMRKRNRSSHVLAEYWVRQIC